MTKTELLQILKDWNLWGSDISCGIERPQYTTRCQSLLATRQVLVITGARRSGKSYVMRQLAAQLAKQGVPPKNILMVNFEDSRFTRLDAALLDEIVAVHAAAMAPDGKPYLLLDEIQAVDAWEKWVRTMHELDRAHLVISGSNAGMLSRELGTVLTGRHVDIVVHPLSFREFLRFKQKTPDVPIKSAHTELLLGEYLEFGAFPEVVLGPEKRELLFRYFDDVIHRDIVRRFNIRRENELAALARFYAGNTAALTTGASLGRSFGLAPNTVEKYAAYFTDAFLFFFLKRFSFKTREQEKNPRKVYCNDTGLVNAVGFRFSATIGRTAENAVFCELQRRLRVSAGQELYYWKDPLHHEVDFVVKDGTRVTQLIQVCWNLENPETKKREVRALLKAMKELTVAEALVINERISNEEKINGHTIKYMPLMEWLMNSSDL